MFKKTCLIIAFLTFSCSYQKSLWEKAKEANTITGYEVYLKQYPEGEFSAEAKALLTKMEFQKAKETNTIEGYKKYLEQYPEGEFSAEAKAQLAKLEFQKAKETNTIEGYEKYLEKYPDDKFSSDAKSQLTELEILKQKEEETEFNKANKQNTIESHHNFLRKYPVGKFWEEAFDNFISLEFKNSSITKEYKISDGVTIHEILLFYMRKCQNENSKKSNLPKATSLYNIFNENSLDNRIKLINVSIMQAAGIAPIGTKNAENDMKLLNDGYEKYKPFIFLFGCLYKEGQESLSYINLDFIKSQSDYVYNLVNDANTVRLAWGYEGKLLIQLISQKSQNFISSYLEELFNNDEQIKPLINRYKP